MSETEQTPAETSTAATSVPETATETPAAAAPPIAAASNANEVAIPAAEEPPVEEAVEKVQKSKVEPTAAAGMRNLGPPHLSHHLLTSNFFFF